MLKKFSVTGFKNFADTVTIDFSDVRDYRFHPECITDGIINTAIIYGKNAVGKTNFGLALFDIVSHLTMNNVTPGLYDYYLNTDNERGYASFEYVFRFGNDEIIYGYNKSEKGSLCTERLMLNGILMFDNNFIVGVSGYKKGLVDLVPSLNWEHTSKGSDLKYFMQISIAHLYPMPPFSIAT